MRTDELCAGLCGWLERLMPEDARRPALIGALVTRFGRETLRGAPAVVLDLRANGGGDLDTAMAVLGWLLGPEPVHISDVIYKDSSVRWHSDPRPGLAPGTPAVALTGAGTYSSGEGLAYHFQAHGRGPVVGTSTPGAADHVTPIVLSTHVRANLPRGYVVDAVTGDNGEQAGVQPDLPCAEAEALERALDLLRAG